MGMVMLFIYWFSVGVLYFVVGVPYIIFNLSIYCLQRGFKEDCSFGCRLVTLILTEIVFYMCGVGFKRAFQYYEEKNQTKIIETTEDEANRLMENSKVSQTYPTWRTEFESDEKDFIFHMKESRLTLRQLTKKKHDIAIKYKKTRSTLEKELESKTKLLSTIKAKTVSLALDLDYLIKQIKTSKTTLERLKDQNEQSMEQYAQLADQIQWEYSQHIMTDQGELYVTTNGHQYQ